jgi:membrane protein DedA with SNARE-associated domain
MDIPLLAATLLATSPLDILDWLLEGPRQIFHGYSSLVRWGAEAAHSLFEDYGYWVVFFGTLCENTLLVGLIVPGALVVILAGLAAEEGSISAPLAVAIAWAGTVLGDTISYCMGRFGWSKFGHLPMFKDVNLKVREPLLKRGALFVLVYHFAGYTRVVGPTAAGFLKMPYYQWAPADYGGALLWVGAYMGIGYGLGALGFSLESTDGWFRVVEWGLLVLVMIWGYYLYRLGQRAWQQHQEELLREAAEEASSRSLVS